ncbi:WD repeat-containing protein 44 [Magnaporthiopsis poae ATCC 64411]|uniref:WD repeat-containing protein 44 n=1 Tax=Magnaporthiopsis poae (strain ATCC 64411 / 73-15) TaxID=644358 RepID=A0A0C4EAT0_MAGP6|nr:WD repeat-containing protein 44 [Magnaporthiopsis poae ATCC 64411]
MADSGGRAHHNVRVVATAEEPRVGANGQAIQQPPQVFATSPSQGDTPPLAESGHPHRANSDGTPHNSNPTSVIKTPKKASTKTSRSDEFHSSAGAATPSSTKDAADQESRPKGAQNGQVEAQSRPSLPVTPARSSTTIDPLSQHIVLRTNTDRSISSRLRSQTVRPDNPSASGGLGSSGDGQLRPPNSDAPEKKKNRVSFLSRLSMRGSKKKGDCDDDNGSERSDHRPDGNDARVFSTVGAGGFIPHHKEPPRYIRTKAHNKKNREFNRMFLAQELIGTKPPKDSGGPNSTTVDASKTPLVTVSSADGVGRTVAKTGGAIWATEFSRDGRFLAAAGRDMVVRVWAVISTHEERRAHEEDEEATHGAAGGERLSAPVFREQPVREFEGHTGEILDLSWSKNNFLLSTSMDRTVRLWHVSRRECLCSFRHSEFVSKVAFHPRDDRFFLAGCLDATLRLWSIPDKAVAYSVQTADLITAVAFSPDGTVAIAGMLSGICNFYETEGLKLQSQLHVRSSRGKNAKGSKITGIQTAELAGSNAGDKVKVLITSTDARVRIYNLRDKTLDVKFKGHQHAVGQLCASFSDDGSYVICPSEDRKTFIWSLGRPPPGAAGAEDGADGGHDCPQAGGGGGVDNLKGDKGPCEFFSAHAAVVTTAIFTPTRTRQLLGNGGDPVYDLCNPPPVTLVSMVEAEEAAAAATAPRSPLPSITSHEAAMHNRSQTALSDAGQTTGSMSRTSKAEQSPAYLARSTHYDGNIIVTSDDTGIIKVFRQDCAYRRRADGFDTVSVLSRRTNSLVGRSASILTRTSASSGGPLSRHGSLSTSMPPGSGFAASSDHILSWRRGVETNDNRAGSAGSLPGSPPLGERAARSERSISPSKSNSRSPNANLASERRRQLYINSSPLAPKNGKKDGLLEPSTFSGARVSGRTPAALLGDKHHDRLDQNPDEADEDRSPSEPPTPAFSFVIGDDGNNTDRAAPMAKHEYQSDETANAASEEAHTPVAEAGPLTKETKEQAEGGTGLLAATGLWSIKWPRMPNLRISIGNLPGIGGGSSGKDGGSPSPGGHGRASSDINLKGDAADGDVKHKDQEKEINGPSDKKSRPSLSDAPGGRPGILKGGRLRRKSSPAVTPSLNSVEFAAADAVDDAAGNGESEQARKTGGAAAVSTGEGAAGGEGLPPQHQRRHSLLPAIPGGARLSMVSRLSSDMASAGSDDDTACRRCGNREFKAKRVGVARQQRFVCAKCGSPASTPAPAQDSAASASSAARRR